MNSVRGKEFVLQSGKTLEIPVKTTQDGSVFDGDSGQVGIGDQIAATTLSEEKPRQQGRMAIGRVRQPSLRMAEPFIHEGQGTLDG